MAYNEKDIPTYKEENEALNAFGYGLDLSQYKR